MPDPLPSSPSTSSFVPLSLLESVKPPTRTLSSRSTSNNPTRGPRPSYAPHNSSGQLQTLTAREKAELAKREAAAMMETLGMARPALESPREADEERALGGVGRAAGAEGAQGDLGREVERLRAALSQRDAELSRARAELGVSNQDKADLLRRVERLEKEKAASAATSSATAPQAATTGGMTARQVEELSRQFAAQESLLNGYQKDSERSFKELETLKAKQRRMAELLGRFCGPNWEQDLLDSALPVSMVALPNGAPAVNGSFSSPALRGRLGPRPSLLGTPLGTPTGRGGEGVQRVKRVSEGDDSFDEEAEMDQEQAGEGQVAQNADAEVFRQQLEAVQAVIRAMQERLIARDGELDTVERRAREEGLKAADKLREIHAVVGRAGVVA